MAFSEEQTDAELVNQTSPEQEHSFHGYTGRRIPWYVRAIWLCFWVFAAYYVMTYLFPSLQIEVIDPP